MSNAKRFEKNCAGMEDKLVQYLDGRAKPVERRAVEDHFAVCSGCRSRAEDFRALFGALDDLPVISPSPSFDAALRARVAAVAGRPGFWGWIPSPRLAFAVAALVAVSVWLASMPRSASNNSAAITHVPAEAEFGMIRDLPVLENYEVISKFDALSELPASPDDPAAGEVKNESSE
jgi:anti-sigma factor RsiW